MIGHAIHRKVRCPSDVAANLGGTIVSGSIVGGISDYVNQYTYDALGRLTSVSQDAQTGGNAVADKLATFTFDTASQLTDLQRYSSTTVVPGNLEVHSRYAYDNAGRLQSITHSQSAIAAGETWTGTSTIAASLQGGALLAGYYLTYDTDNRLTEWSSYYDAFKTTYSYDTRDELTGATHTAIPGLTPPLTLPSAESYSFDGTGNRNLSGGGSSSATGTHNEVQNDGTYTYLYDNEGNQTSRTVIATGAVTEYAWDYRNRLVEVTERASATGAATSVVTFQYDAFDRRTGKQVDSNADGTIDREKAWVWEGDQVALQLVDADGAGSGTWKLANRYLYGDMVDMILADEQLPNGGIGLTTVSTTSGNVLWPLADHLGSVRDLVDSNGVIREHVVYDSFGNRLSESDFDASGNPIASNNPAAVDHLFGYTGREWDRDVDLQYNRARWYDPVQGRWLSQDPIGFSAGDANLYRYVGNGVTGATDPSGLEPPRGGWHPHGPPPPGMGSPVRTSHTKITISGLIEGQLIGRILQIGKLGNAGPKLHCSDYSREFEDAFRADIATILRRLGERYRDKPIPNGKVSLTIRGIRNPNNKGEWRWPTSASFDTGWWLNGAHNVTGQFEFRVKEVDGHIQLTGVRTTWIWEDEIDARGCKQWWNAKNDWGETLKGIPNLIIESIFWDKLIDGLLDADFEIKITTPWIEHDDIDTNIPRN